MNKQNVFNYIMNTPHNTNPNVLASLLSEPTSWNDLKDKPFYEETTTVSGDMLTWDGNTEGLVSFANMMYKVSDAVPTVEDFVNGYEAESCNANGEKTSTSATYTNMENQGFFNQQQGFIVLGDFGIVVMKDNLDLGNGTVYPEAGVWLMNNGSLHVSRFTIPGYTGFVTTTTVVKPIDAKYLPEHLQFGEEKAFEPIVWDGNTEGLESVELGAETQLYKVSDQIIADSKDIAYYRYHNTANGGVDIDTAGDQITVTSIADGVFLSTDKMFLCCSVPFSTQGIDFTPGVYFGKSVLSDRTFTTTAMYPKTTVTPLAEQYMPILTSPSGKKFKLSVDDNGTITATEVS